MSNFNRQVGNPNVMGVPTYDNGMGYAPPTRKVRSVPARKPEVQVAPRVQSHNVLSSRAPLPVAPVAPLHTIRRKPVAPAPGMAKYVDRPLPALPGSAAAARRPQGISKPATLNLNKPLPPLPHEMPMTRPTVNGVYTSTGQRIAAPVEQSAWSNTTESTRAVQRRQKRDKHLQTHSAAIISAAKPGKTTKAPELLKTHITVGKPGQDRGKIQEAQWTAVQAADRYQRHREEEMAQARVAAARRAIIPGRNGIHRDTMRTPQWQALTEREKSVLAHQYEQESVRKQARNTRKNSSKCSVM